MKTPTGNNRLPLIIVAILVILLGAGWAIWRATRSGGTGGNQHPYRILGAGVGEEAGKLAGRNAPVVVIVAGGEGDPAAEKNAKIFNETLAGQGLKILATETIPLPELAMLGGPGKKIPGGHYVRILEKHPGATAIISLAGYPAFTDSVPPASAPRAAFVAVVAAALDPMTEGPELERLLQSGVVRLAVTRRSGTVPSPGGSQSLRAQFDTHYQVHAPAK